MASDFFGKKNVPNLPLEARRAFERGQRKGALLRIPWRRILWPLGVILAGIILWILASYHAL
jgi:hypothetical protein